MPSGKKAREQRRQAAAAPPPVRSKGSSAGRGARQASPRALAIGGGAVVVIVIAVVLAVVLSGGGNSSANNSGYNGDGDTTTLRLAGGTPAIGSSTNAPAQYAADVASLLKGIPQHGFVLGASSAPITLIEYIDLQCPVCQNFELNAFPELVTKYVKTGKLRIEMKTWNILDLRDNTVDSLRGQKATIAAADQNKAFNFAALLYNNQKLEGTNWMNDAAISNFAASVDGLDTAKFITDANSSATQQLINSIDSYANSREPAPGQPGSQQFPFAGTPTLFLTKGTGTPQYYGTGWGQAPVDLPSIEAKINQLLLK